MNWSKTFTFTQGHSSLGFKTLIALKCNVEKDGFNHQDKVFIRTLPKMTSHIQTQQKIERLSSINCSNMWLDILLK